MVKRRDFQPIKEIYETSNLAFRQTKYTNVKMKKLQNERILFMKTVTFLEKPLIIGKIIF